MTDVTPDYMDIPKILQMIPHRYPFLLIDRVCEVLPGKSIVGIKNVTYNEPQFTGHFPNMPIMPGVLIIEAMAQLSAILIAKTLNAKPNQKMVYFMSIDNAKFRKTVVPGDTLHIYSDIEQSRGEAWKFKAKSMVGDSIVAGGNFMAMVKDREQK